MLSHVCPTCFLSLTLIIASDSLRKSNRATHTVPQTCGARPGQNLPSSPWWSSRLVWRASSSELPVSLKHPAAVPRVALRKPQVEGQGVEKTSIATRQLLSNTSQTLSHSSCTLSSTSKWKRFGHYKQSFDLISKSRCRASRPSARRACPPLHREPEPC